MLVLAAPHESESGPTRTPPWRVGRGPVTGVLRPSTGKTLDQPTISASTDATICKALSSGDTGIRKIATTLGVGAGTVQRIKAEMSAAV